MPRKPRTVSCTGLYHAVFKGVNGVVLFEDDDDRRRMLKYLEEACCKFGIMILAWCLMNNHVHLALMEADEQGGKALSKAMHSVCGRYAQYFNRRHGRSGHLYKDRFWSDTLETEGHLLETVRYIHNNPAKAGICEATGYSWSSASDYSSGSHRLTNPEIVLGAVGGYECYLEFAAGACSADPIPRAYERVSEYEALEILKEIPGIFEGSESRRLFGGDVRDRDAGIVMAYSRGVTSKQIVWLTGIALSIVARAISSRGHRRPR